MANSNRRKSKGFIFWPSDWLAATSRLSPESYQAYHRILCWMWLEGENQCSIPNDPDALAIATMIHDPSQLMRVMAEIQNRFAPLLSEEGGYYVSAKLREIALASRERSDEARHAAITMWYKKHADASKNDADASKKHADASKNDASYAGAGSCSCSCSSSYSIPDPDPDPKKPDAGIPANTHTDPAAQEIHQRRVQAAKRSKTIEPLEPLTSLHDADLVSECCGLETNGLRASKRGFWQRRCAAMRASPGGENVLRDLLKEIADRANPRLCATKGYNGPVTDPAAWLNKMTNKWLKERQNG